jgi:hypothetical protein
MVHGQSYERVQKISSILVPIIHHWNYMDTFYYALNRSIHKNETRFFYDSHLEIDKLWTFIIFLKKKYN